MNKSKAINILALVLVVVIAGCMQTMDLHDAAIIAAGVK